MDFSKLNSKGNIEDLLLECREKRHANICKEVYHVGEIFIKGILITNDYQKPIIDPLFLYITMLPVDIIPTDSILSFEILNNKLVVKIYSDNNDNETGIKLNIDLLKRMDIIVLKLIRLPIDAPYITNSIKLKLDKLRIIKDDWEFLQIYDCIDKTKDIFGKLTRYIHIKQFTKEQNLESIYYKNLIKGNYRVPYLPIIGSSENASYIHYYNNNCLIKKGSVILMDCGVKNKYGYASDITRTVINEACPLQIKLYNIVKKAHNSCLVLIRQYLSANQTKISFTTLNDRCIYEYIHEFAKLETDERYTEWSDGIINCKLNSFYKAKKFVLNFYTHFIGHNIGLNTHDPYHDNYLHERCVFTIEPGIYFNKNSIEFAIPQQYYDIGGIRIEDMYTILQISGSLQLIHLSDNIPKI